MLSIWERTYVMPTFLHSIACVMISNVQCSKDQLAIVDTEVFKYLF